MEDWEDGRKTKADEHAGSKRSPKRGPELGIHGYSSAADANGSDLRCVVQKWFVMGQGLIQTYHTPIESLQHWLAIEAVVHARDEASKNESDDA